MKVSNGLCQSPSFLGQEELGSGYEIGEIVEAVCDVALTDFSA